MLPAMVSDSEFTAEELAKDMDGLQMKFPRVKIPSGSALRKRRHHHALLHP